MLIFSLSDDLSSAKVSLVKQELEKYGFCVWAVKDTTGEESETCKNFLDFNLWKINSRCQNNFRIKTLIIAYDLAATNLTFTQRYLYPRVDNSRLLLFAYHVQKRLSSFEKIKAENRLLCSTANDETSWQCISRLWPDKVQELGAAVQRDMKSLASNNRVLKELTRTGCFSKVYLIEFEGQLAVEKIYRPGCAQKFNKEKEAYLELAEKVDAIPYPLLVGENSFVLPYIREGLKIEPSGCRLVPLESIELILETLKGIYEAGYAVIDCHSANCLFESASKVWFIDFEYLYRYKSQPRSFFESYDVVGIPDDFDGDVPSGRPEYLKHPWLNEFGVTPRFAIEKNKVQIKFFRTFFWLRKTFPAFCYRKTRSVIRLMLASTNYLLGKLYVSRHRIIRIGMRP